MSTMGEDRLKIVLPRSGPDEFWQTVQQHYAECDSRKWKPLAMLALREAADWPLELIGLAFDHPKGHVQRKLEQIKRDLRERFRAEDEKREMTNVWAEDGGSRMAKGRCATDD